MKIVESGLTILLFLIMIGIPCLTLSDNTERPVTITQGTNILVGTKPGKIIKEALSIVSRIRVGKMEPERTNKPERPNRLNRRDRPDRPKYWDGKAAARIAKILLRKLK